MTEQFYCSDCGQVEESLDDLTYTECCGTWLCDRCLEEHDAKYTKFPEKDFDVAGASITKEQARKAVQAVKAKEKK